MLIILYNEPSPSSYSKYSIWRDCTSIQNFPNDMRYISGGVAAQIAVAVLRDEGCTEIQRKDGKSMTNTLYLSAMESHAFAPRFYPLRALGLINTPARCGTCGRESIGDHLGLGISRIEGVQAS